MAEALDDGDVVRPPVRGVVRSDPLQLIEQWWGEALTASLANRILSAPLNHLTAFAEFLHEQVVGPPLPELAPGRIRPILKYNPADAQRGRAALHYLRVAPPMLLYTHEIAIEDPLPFLLLENRSVATEAMEHLLALQPLARSGAVVFFKYPDRFRHPVWTHRFVSSPDEELMRELPNYDEWLAERRRLSAIPRDYNFGQLIFHSQSAIGLSVLLAQEAPGRLNVVATSAEEAVLLPIGMRKAALAAPETRNLHLAKLSAMQLPSLRGDAVLAVRQSAEEFAEWRRALGSALQQVKGISSDDVSWQRDARSIMQNELEPIRNRLERAVGQSPALTVAKSGALTLGYSALGALAGAAGGGNVAAGLIGAAAGRGAEVGVNYLRALREQRRNRAVLDLALTYYREVEDRTSAGLLDLK